MTLRIGISARLLHDPPPGLGLPQKRLQFLESSMAHWIMAHGAIALMVPFIDEASSLSVNRAPVSDIVDLLDGLVLQGGIDICPETYDGTLVDPAWLATSSATATSWRCCAPSSPRANRCSASAVARN